jgi:hypothetical protein
MTWYAVYHGTTGELRSLGTVLAAPDVLAARGLVAVELAGEPPQGMRWDTAARAYVPGPVIKATLSKLDFMDRFTDAEWDNLVAYQSSNGTTAQKRRVAGILERIKLLDVVDLSLPRTQQAITFLSTVNSPPITAARAAEIIG